MSYRKLKVKDRNFRYVVGKTHVKIQEPSTKGSWLLDIETLNTVCITPAYIRRWVLREVFKIQEPLPKPKCGCGEDDPSRIEFTCSPYALEIHHKKIYLWYCKRCLDSEAWDI